MNLYTENKEKYPFYSGKFGDYKLNLAILQSNIENILCAIVTACMTHGFAAKFLKVRFGVHIF